MSLRRLIPRQRQRATECFCLDPGRSNTPAAQVLLDGVNAFFGELHVRLGIAQIVGMTFELYDHPRIVVHHLNYEFKLAVRFGADSGPAHLEDEVI